MKDIREVCQLSGEALTARRGELRRELLPHVRGRERLPDGIALGFEASDAMRAALTAFVDFERRCCPGLRVSWSETEGALRLEIRGLDPDADVLEDLGVPAERSWMPGLAGAARSAVGGVGGAFVLFCLVPMGAAALLGAELAAPLRALDHPLVIGLGGAALAGWLWRRERRRATGCGC